MHSVARLLTVPRFAAIMFVVFFVAVYTMVGIGIVPVDVLCARFEVALQSVIALSVSLIIFPFITVPAVESIVSKAERVGVKVSNKLVEDYVHGCYTIFLLSVVEVVLIIVYSFLGKTLLTLPVILLALSTLAVLIIVLLILVYSLWKVTLLLQRILKA